MCYVLVGYISARYIFGGIMDRIMAVIPPLVIIVHMFAAKLNYPVNL
jgi:hypothetical protein